MELSVIIVVRDNWRQLFCALEQIAGQDAAPNFEVILVDDGSRTPPPAALFTAFAGLRLRYQRQIALGIAEARNRGISLARGEIIVFVDSDCLCERDCLKNVVRAMREYPSEVAFQLSLSSNRASLVEEAEGLRLQAVQASLRLASGHILYANTSGFAVRTFYAHRNAPLFDPAFVRGEDTGMLARLLHQERPPRFLLSCSVRHCPRMPFTRYALKHFWIGYHTSAAREQLRASGSVLMSGSQRRQMLKRLWSASHNQKLRKLALPATLLCYGLECLGRTTARLKGTPPREHALLSLRVNAVSQSGLISSILAAAEQKRGFLVSYANGWTLVQARRSRTFMRLLNSVDVCYPDGLGVVVTSLLQRLRWVSKVTAEDFIFQFCQELAERRLSLALVGAQLKVIQMAGTLLRKVTPNLKISVQSSGYLSPPDDECLVQELVRQQPSVILVGMGQPLQEEWAIRMRQWLPGTVFWCVGGLFDYLVGSRRCADCARRLGLEWMQKFCRSPRRMGRRYLIGIPALMGYIAAHHGKRLGERLKQLAKASWQLKPSMHVGSVSKPHKAPSL